MYIIYELKIVRDSINTMDVSKNKVKIKEKLKRELSSTKRGTFMQKGSIDYTK